MSGNAEREAVMRGFSEIGDLHEARGGLAPSASGST
jgi:hypothetical protein